MALMTAHPDLDPQEVGLERLSQLVLALPDFMDDPALANERILIDIQITWYEEAFE
jgi:FeS assembly protein IscX